MSRVQKIDGRPIVDAKKALRLIITSDDVKRANVKKPNSCAIAQTCLRQPGVKEVRIHLSRAYLRSNATNWQRFMVPKTLRSEIIAFDRGGRFSPGEYTLYRMVHPKPRNALSAQTKTGRGKKRRGVRHVVTDVRSGPA